MRKYQIMRVHAFGINVHGFWTGVEWSSNEEDGALYNNKETAEKVTATFADKVNVGYARYDIPLQG